MGIRVMEQFAQSMNRTAKFRGFNHHYGWLIGYPVDLKSDKVVGIKPFNGKHQRECEISTIGQFIGIRARGKEGTGENGEGWKWKTEGRTTYPLNMGPELFEGDIVECVFDNGRSRGASAKKEAIRCLVKWNNDDCSWQLHRLQKGKGYGRTDSLHKGVNLKLVGNATQHPWLLLDEPAPARTKEIA